MRDLAILWSMTNTAWHYCKVQQRQPKQIKILSCSCLHFQLI